MKITPKKREEARRRLLDLLQMDIFTDAPEYSERVGEVQDLMYVALGDGGQPKPAPFIYAEYDAGGDTFRVFARNMREARKAMKEAWETHVAQSHKDGWYNVRAEAFTALWEKIQAAR